jgi:endoglucanase
MNRRHFLQTAATAAVAAGAAPTSLFGAPDPAGARALPMPSPAKLPRWRGFNLLEKFTYRGTRKAPFVESDFAQIAEWGFDFTRLPMSYLCWTDPANWRQLQEEPLKEIDQAVEWGRQYGIHVNLNFHRAPGYCVNPPREPKDLWTDDDALETCAHHWGEFAKRYKGIPNDRLSFDLLNEPADVKEEVYFRVVKRMVAAIRDNDPNRLIIADGLRWGRDPVHSLAELRVGQSTRGYDPFKLTHYKAGWASGSDKWAEPTWPMTDGSEGGTLEKLRRDRIQPWKDLAAKGVGVHVGEWGVFQHTPHAVTLAWMKDVLGLWKEAGWGWALWNFRGSFGVLDSNRKDVAYEDFKGHKLDRKMLELLRSH